MNRLILVMALIFGAGLARAEVAIQQVTSPGGIQAWLVEEPSIPFVALEISFRGGASLDLPGKRGASNLMVGLLEEGAGPYDAAGFAEATEALAARFDFDIGDDGVSISAQMLNENRDAAVALLREALVNPNFPEQSVERVRGQVLSGLKSDALDPESLAGQAFDAAFFGDHPYGSSLDGTIESVTALTRDDLVTAHRNALTQDRLFVSAAGDINAAELGALMDSLLGVLPETGPALPERPVIEVGGGVTVVPFETPQSVALFGHEGLSRDDPDFFAAYVLNVILGGGSFESRLMEEVREKRGLTYGVYSFLVGKELADLYIGQVSSANDRIGDAMRVIRDEWRRMAEEGPTLDELETTKTYLTGAYPLRFDGNGSIASILLGMQVQGLSPDYVNTRNSKIEAVTLEDIQRVAQRVLKPEDLHFFVVGQPEGL